MPACNTKFRFHFLSPAGGGQWEVQGPVAMQAAVEIGADVPKVAMAVAFGDEWRNLIHPLIAFPVLAIARLQARDIIGYCAVALLYTGPIFLISLLPLHNSGVRVSESSPRRTKLFGWDRRACHNIAEPDIETP
jgi:hypothetical protein